MADTYLPLTKVCLLLAFRCENSQCYNLIRIQVPEEGLVIKMKRAANVVSLKKTMDTDAVEEHLKTFDELDYDVFSNQNWTRLHESHSKDVKVNWPDGHSTLGIEKHIEDLKAMFVYAPDTSIKVHPVKFGSGEYTSVIGVMTGTFTRPMPIGDGKFIQPTGKKFSIPMCTVGHWKDGVMNEEWLFWDNATYLKQIGIGN
jgi:SnoaL-like polyketide cyclase